METYKEDYLAELQIWSKSRFWVLSSTDTVTTHQKKAYGKPGPIIPVSVKIPVSTGLE